MHSPPDPLSSFNVNEIQEEEMKIVTLIVETLNDLYIRKSQYYANFNTFRGVFLISKINIPTDWVKSKM